MRSLTLAVFGALSATALSLPEASAQDAATLAGFELREIGPAMCSGRVADFAVDPTRTSRWFVAAASGGVWRTLNNGTTFEPVFDGEGSYSIGCVTLDPSNPHTVWVGTGENNGQRSVSWGDGVYRSRDGGDSWEHLGLEDSQHIGMIQVDPRDSDVVWVAAQGPLWNSGGDRGLYKTTDGGQTWTRVLHVSDDTGINEVFLDPRDPDTVYASAWQHRRHVWTLIDGGPESGIYKSTDGGDSWRKIEQGLPGVDKGRIGMAISPVNPDVLYAIVEAQRGKGGLFRSSNRGESWQKMSNKVASSPQYYNELVASPHDVDTVISLETWTGISRDGGKTFSPLGNLHRHVDDHALWIDPSDAHHMIIGCDGGVYDTFDGGAHWDFKENLPLGQFYRVSADMAEPFYNVYGGTQDNNSMGGPSRTNSLAGITNDDWFVTVGGDGYEAVVDPTDPNIVYTQWQYGGLVRHDRRSGEITDIKPRQNPGEPPLVWNWDSPLILSNHDHKTLYFAADRLFKSDDRGDTWQRLSGDLTRGIDRDQLKVMGSVPHLDAVARHVSTSIYGNAVALTESPLKTGTLWVGTDDGLVHVTQDDGQSWRKIATFPGIPDQTYVSELEASRHVAGRVYAGFSNHKNGDFKPYLLVSEDFGATWRSIAGNLPANNVVWTVVEDHVDPNLLFCGTEYGLFVSFDAGGAWHEFGSNLPTVAVRDLEIQRRENDLIVGTFGRGIWILDDYAPLREMAAAAAQDAHLFAVRAAPLYIEGSRLGLNTGLGAQGSTYYHADNPPFGALLTFHLKDGLQTRKEQREKGQAEARQDGADFPVPDYDARRAEDMEEAPTVHVTIRDAQGSVIARVPAPRGQGLHRIAWDLRHPDRIEVDLNAGGPGAPWSMPDAGPLVLGGSFSATLDAVVDGAAQQLAGPVSFRVEPLNLASLPAEDRAEVLAFQQQVVELRRAVRMASKALGDCKSRIDHLRVAVRDTPQADQSLLGRLQRLDDEAWALRVLLSGDSTRSSRSDETDLSVAARVENIAGAQLYTSSAPTSTERDGYAAAADAFGPLLSRLRKLSTEDLAQIETTLERLGAPATPGRLPEWRR